MLSSWVQQVPLHTWHCFLLGEFICFSPPLIQFLLWLWRAFLQHTRHSLLPLFPARLAAVFCLQHCFLLGSSFDLLAAPECVIPAAALGTHSTAWLIHRFG